ncbi:phage integrase SAM-like domain-containing protein [Reichenbachiella sp.]|uniref:phage integrase SAM-like domain-containing protein n=1 Tax=Reichenbachiella sp. TaxID=2184521 RepID=UPI003BB0D6F8
MATVKALIKRNKIDANGKATIYVKYRHKQKVVELSTSMKVDSKNWNDSKEVCSSLVGIKVNKTNEELIKTLKRADLLTNSTIANFKARIIEISRELRLKGDEPDAELVKTQFLESREGKRKQEGKELLLPLYCKFVRNCNKSDGTKANYMTAVYHLEKFEKAKKRTLTLNDISLKLYDDLMYFLYHEIEKSDKTKGLADNTVGTSIKNFKVFLTYLLKRGYPIPNITSEIKVPRVDTPIYFLTENEVDILEQKQFKSERLSQVRDVFVFNCYTGLRYSDLSRLQKDHIVDDVIEMRAYKNQKDLYVPLSPRSERILKKYNYQLPIISEQKYNDYIKEACEKAGITKEVEVIKTSSGNKSYTYVPKFKVITSHIAVKTFISLCGKKGISPKIVSEITGKSVEIIIKHYYGIDRETIKEQMRRGFSI